MSITSSTLLRNTLKLAGAGATIAAIAWGFLTMNPDGEVAESQADIIDLDVLAPQTKTQKFVAALDALGHEEPRIYDYNGTQVFFSTRATTKRPRDLIREYQEAFVSHGVNSKVWEVSHSPGVLDDPAALDEKAREYKRQMLDGELQVIYHDDDHVIMSGAVVDGSKFDYIADNVNKTHTVIDFHKLFKMHRYIEAEWNPISKKTLVTASWSDEHFDITKTMPESLQDPRTRHMNNSPDLEIPACIACTRLTRFAAVANDKPYVTQIFESTESAETIASFYRDAMRTAGWQKMPGDSLRDRLDDPEHKKTEFMQFQRNGRFAAITVHPDDSGTGSTITTMTSD